MVDDALAALTTPSGYASALGQVVAWASRRFHFNFSVFFTEGSEQPFGHLVNSIFFPV